VSNVGKYYALEQYLERSESPTITLTFEDKERFFVKQKSYKKLALSLLFICLINE